MKCLLVMMTLLLLASVAHAIDPVALDDPRQDARYRQLIEEIRCLVCQNQTLADSSAPLAVDLREQVRDMVERGATDDEIVSYLTARYGDFVLYRPPFNRVTAMLWLSPVIFLLIAGGLAWRLICTGADSAPRDLNSVERDRIRGLLSKREDA